MNIAATSPAAGTAPGRAGSHTPARAARTSASAAAGRAGSRRTLAGAGAVLAALAVAALAGCSAASLPPAGQGTNPATGGAAGTSAPEPLITPSGRPATPNTSASSSPPSVTGGVVPVLGRPAGTFAQGQGFGQARPAKIFNGGDPTGLVTQITWKSWGGSQAIGSGTSDYVGPGQSVATGTEQAATVVAFNLGHCHGTLMYKAVEWYFPAHGQAFDPTHYENICAGSYVPGP